MESGQLDRHAELFLRVQSCYCSQSPEAAGFDVCSSSSSSSWPAEDTPPAVLVQCFPPPSERCQAGEACVSGLHPPLEGPGPALRCPTGGPSPQETGHLNGCVADRLGSCLGRTYTGGMWQPPWNVEAHKRPQTEGHPSRSSEIPAGVTKPTSFQVAEELLTWAWPRLSSVRAVHIPSEKRAVDILT